MSSYLALRAIDEIEDHVQLDKRIKIGLLCAISNEFQKRPSNSANRLATLLNRYESRLPQVTNRLQEWIDLAPPSVASRICEATAAMAQRMIYWVRTDWQILVQRDLDNYTFSVAGSVGLLLSDLWLWDNGTQTSRRDAIAFGRGLQAVNILRNRPEDLARGIDFFPDGWVEEDLVLYARRNLGRANSYVDSLPFGPIKEFCIAPLTLAYATLNALACGEHKLSRDVVLSLTQQKCLSNIGVSDRSLQHMIKDGHIDDSTHLGIAIHPNVTTYGCNQISSRESEEVVLVNEKDEVVGVEEKIKTHQLGVLHRAFSIFIFNSEGLLLLQKRTRTKYHSKGLWSNTCCGHPRLNETTQQASRRRLREEMGFDCKMKEVFQFVYRAKLDGGLIEHEYDHVFVGEFEGDPLPDKNEVDDWKWINLAALNLDLQNNPEIYTCWFKIALDRLLYKLEIEDVHLLKG
jgi:farnesyl-diphosphate farnesyltransferase